MELTPAFLTLGLVWFVVFLFSTTLHEAAHAFVAYRLGDPTAYHGGQVTLNPVPHIAREPIGMVAVPIVSFALAGWVFGWASAPYDPAWAARHPRRSAWMALAGPVANLTLALLAFAGIKLGLATGHFVPPAPDEAWIHTMTLAAPGSALGGLATLLSVLFSLNLILCLFNLLPVPPLDGSGVVQLLLSERAARRYQELVYQPMLGLMGIVIAWRLFGQIFHPLIRLALDLLYPGLGYR
jgi:Zn-dependent protease